MSQQQEDRFWKQRVSRELDQHRVYLDEKIIKTMDEKEFETPKKKLTLNNLQRRNTVTK
jgi:hypothetical protein